MNNSSSFGSRKENHNSQYVNSDTCQICDGKKYTLISSRKVNKMSIVYEKKDCPNCVGVRKPAPPVLFGESSGGGKKMLSGTGYLRNKKRRRKDDSQESQGSSDVSGRSR